MTSTMKGFWSGMVALLMLLSTAAADTGVAFNMKSFKGSNVQSANLSYVTSYGTIGPEEFTQDDTCVSDDFLLGGVIASSIKLTLTPKEGYDNPTFKLYYGRDDAVAGTYSSGASISLTEACYVADINATPATYTLTLNQDGGNGGDTSVSVAYLSSLPDISVPAKANSRFAGYWYGDTQYYDAAGKSVIEQWTLTSAITLKAKWIDLYTVTFKDENGTGSYFTKQLAFGDELPALAVPLKEGARFTGYFDEEGVQYYDADGTGLRTWDKKDATLTARWTTAYTIRFDKNNSNATGAMADFEGNWGSETNLPPCGFSRSDGYTFGEWNTAPDGVGTNYADKATVSNVCAIGEIITLYAQWKDAEAHRPVTLTFHAEEGGWTNETGEITSTAQTTLCQTCDHYVLPAVDPVHSDTNHYKFAGWGVATNDVLPYYSQIQSGYAATDYYAQWEYVPDEISKALGATNLIFTGDISADHWYITNIWDETEGKESTWLCSGSFTNKRETVLSTTVKTSGTLSFTWKGENGYNKEGYYVEDNNPSDCEYSQWYVEGETTSETNTLLTWGPKTKSYTVEIPEEHDVCTWVFCRYNSDSICKRSQPGYLLLGKVSFVPETNSVTFLKEGSCVERRFYSPGLRYGELPTLETPGYWLKGWSTNETAAGIISERTIFKNEDGYTNLTAILEPITYQVTFDAKGGTGAPSAQRFVVYTDVITWTCEPTRENYAFCGWSTNESATAAMANADLKMLATEMNAEVPLFAVWKANETPTPPEENPDPSEDNPSEDDPSEPDPTPVPEEPVVLTQPLAGVVTAGDVPTGGMVYNGYMTNQSGVVTGTYVLTVKKAKNGTAKATFAVTDVATGKKKSYGGTVVVETGVCYGNLGGILLGARGVSGTWNGAALDGVVDATKAKDATAVAIQSAFKGRAYALACSDAAGEMFTATVTLAAKGKARVAGTFADGTKLSTSSQLSVGNGTDVACVPIVWMKKDKGFSAACWFDAVTYAATSVTGLPLNWALTAWNAAANPAAGAYTFAYEAADLAALLPNAIDETPSSAALVWTGSKMIVENGKNAAVTYKKGVLDVNTTKGTNVLQLKLTVSKGAFKGSFAVYALSNGHLVKNTFTLAGVFANGIGYGTAYNKKLGSFPVSIR